MDLRDIKVTDSNGDVYYQSPSVPVVCTPAPVGAVGAKLMKTEQTTSYATGDDGDLQEGRDVDFFTLPSNSPFGNTNRFTDELGGSTYTNNIVIDWSTYDGAEVLGYYRIAQGVNTWVDAVANALVLSIGTFTSGWRLVNMREMQNLMKIGSRAFNWSPINQGNANTVFWTSTTLTGYTNQPWQCSNAFSSSGNSPATSYVWLGCRNFTVTGTTLT